MASFSDKGKSLFAFLYLWVSLYSQLPIKVIQRLGVSDAAVSRHFPRFFTKLWSFCASLRPCCVFSFRRPRCFLISFKSCRAANSASSACFFRSLPSHGAACNAFTALYNPSNRLTSAGSGFRCATIQGYQTKENKTVYSSNNYFEV